MTTPPAGISEADWAATPVGVKAGFLELVSQCQRQQQEIEQLRIQLTALATELAHLRERIGRSSRNSSKPPSSDGQGFKPPERRKGSVRKRGGQPGHPGSGPELLPIERVDEVVEHHPQACRRCGTLLQGQDPEPLRHQVIEIPPITPLVIEHRLHRLVCPCCSTSTCASLPAEVEVSHYGPRLSALVGLLGSAFLLSFSKTQALLDQLLGVQISRGAMATIRQRLSAALEQPMQEALAFARQQSVVYVDETGAPTGNADGGNPDGRRGWEWVMVTTMGVTVFIQSLSRSAAAAIELLGDAFGGIVVSDRFSAYNHLPVQQRQLCWAHVSRDLTAIADRQGASAQIGAELLGLKQQLFAQWHQWKDGTIDWPMLQEGCQPIRQAFVGTLQRVVELGCQRGERTPWAKTVGTCRQLLQVADGLWTFLEIKGIEPTNNAAERALRHSVIQRKISHGVQSRQGAICRSRLLTVTTSLRQQGRDIWQFLEQALIAHHRGGEMPSLLPNP
ncbi:IS66 family transposase ISCysp4 [Synechococcus sp. CBW1107]|jgi:transposase|uniref:IS66 family transposase n=1 Tax=Synechococcus sp. CBW1107 TaxID=2789857 RepID=UPI002AD4540D|nr:IS66 family transposase [Synechococcus sp. CBW1107]CAK6688803.1 IS66 family transposase ISCysp4 [Synechococcus sp. CBW1107]CAK6688914.1 IS66 family transposase ISCysp4 [Synechococcus sp. CBW1107]CAK6689804.1 IS66 family transposase ISCysp4 [Synechococcus sp. CBW1107]CAK6690414.1 IS66 family transposase ISCysp4 [Synechococcus sp. CBW1107]CAK6691668.1 IS66 family transposase ISCysp4 [Synechococcus sp. CBW1107]